MTIENAVGVKTTGADTYISAFTASAQAEGKTRLIQIVSLTAGKIDSSVGVPTRSVSSDDSLDVTTISGDILVGDNGYLAIYVSHSQAQGSCLITPLLCDDAGAVIGTLESKRSQVQLPIIKGTDYLTNCLSWKILETGAWKLYAHVSDLSESNEVDLWCYLF